MACRREGVVTRKPTKVPTNQGWAHDGPGPGPGPGRVTWETHAVLLELGIRS